MISRLRIAAALAILATALSSPATAQQIPLTTFVAGQPARVSDVNRNFTNLKSAIELEQRRNAALVERIRSLEASLSKMIALNQVVSIEAVNGVRTVRFSGVNLQVVNGTNFTESINGAGNFIIGYDETNLTATQEFCSRATSSTGFPTETEAACLAAGGVFAATHKSGSHNLVMGTNNNYSSAAGIVAGRLNSVNEMYASVLGGVQNRSSGTTAVIVGGQGNLTLSRTTAVLGGQANRATGPLSSVAGGRSNTASGNAATVSGGERNTASGGTASVSGGSVNTASGAFSNVVAGRGNTAAGIGSSILGGNTITVTAADTAR